MELHQGFRLLAFQRYESDADDSDDDYKDDADLPPDPRTPDEFWEELNLPPGASPN